MITRRDLLIGGGAALLACRAPMVRTRRPSVTHGVQVGDVGTGTALVWARSDEPARMMLEWDTSPRFAAPRAVLGPVVTPESGLAATVPLTGLPSGQRVFVRARFDREGARGTSDWATASFATPSSDRFRIAWTGDTCGQGYGRNPEWGGLRGYAALRAAEPALWINSGDLIYADNPIPPEIPLGDRTWRNITNERLVEVAESLDDFRARFAYNLEDDHVRALAAEVPVIAQWDDHETHDNWWPGQEIEDRRYGLRDATLLAERALRALREWTPVPAGPIHRVISYGPLLDIVVVDCRSFRTPNDRGVGTSMLGYVQANWLVDTLARSRARWKVVACDQPLGLVIRDGRTNEQVEGYANGVVGAPAGRELELARILSGLHERGVRNVVWVTADVHYAAAHHFDPARATEAVFTPFWEFVAGPIHAGTFGPNPLDPTFGPEVRFQWAPPPRTSNLAPWDGLQSFGTIDVSAEVLKVALWGIDGRQRFTVELPHEA